MLRVQATSNRTQTSDTMSSRTTMVKGMELASTDTINPQSLVSKATVPNKRDILHFGCHYL